MVTLIYHKKLDDAWSEAARKLRSALALAVDWPEAALSIVGRSRKQKVEVDRDFVTERLTVGGRELVYKQVGSECSYPRVSGFLCTIRLFLNLT
jgi:tRNA (uracil-5-)-methyltransferase